MLDTVLLRSRWRGRPARQRVEEPLLQRTVPKEEEGYDEAEEVYGGYGGGHQPPDPPGEEATRRLEAAGILKTRHTLRGRV